MPRQIDSYVLEKKIGAGQFGEVYKGWDKKTGKDVAVKMISRELIKGKFRTLFENEIKVLRACNNINIVKLYDIKKTEHNIYLMLEYCNEGDLKDYLSAKGSLSEDEAVDFLIQILHAFKTLVKHNIMHRDFKLANVLKHNGILKVADFGFCKFLGEGGMASTYLGSPLNMAPEVLLGKNYDSKADIWSIGSVFYELLFGEPVFKVTEYKDLMKQVIEGFELQIPEKGGVKISKVTEDVLKRMLVCDPEKRITWKELLGHKITTYREEKIMKELNTSINQSTTQNLKENMSKFYVNNNKVVQHVQDFNKKSQINQFALGVVKGNNKDLKFTGPVIQHTEEQSTKEEKKSEEKVKPEQQAEEAESSKGKEGEPSKEVIEREKRIKIIQNNSNRTLHERNKYLFLASVADEATSFQLKLSTQASFLLIKKLNYMTKTLKVIIEKGDKQQLSALGITDREIWRETKEYENILKFLLEEEEIFFGYFGCLAEKLQTLSKQELELVPGFEGAATLDLNEEKRSAFEEIYALTLKMYMKFVLDEAAAAGKSGEETRLLWVHLDNLMTAIQVDEFFRFSDEKGKQFDFTKFYEEMQAIDADKLKKRVLERSAKLKL